VKAKKLIKIAVPISVAVIGASGAITAAAISAHHSGDSTAESSSRSTYCRALVSSAEREAAALGSLQSSISVATPSGRITGHSARFGAAYNAVTSQTRNVIQAGQHYKSRGGQISSDPKLGGDLIQIDIDLANLHEAVMSNGTGGAQWNQLSNYQADFQQLAQMTCPQ